jgi:protein SFI1
MFRPSRVSSPSKPKQGSSRATTHSDSFASAPELAALAPDEIEFIDAVVARAGPGASTFLAVLKAYNDILRERGMDSRNEVVYYAKLLKLGTTKGADWAAKWAAVRAAQPALVAGPARQNTHAGPSRAVNSRLNSVFPTPPRDPDTFTLHSHEDEDEDDTIQHPTQERSHSVTPRAATRARQRTRTRTGSPESSAFGNSLGLETGPLSSVLTPHVKKELVEKSRLPQLWDSISEASDDYLPSATAQLPQSTPVKRRPPVAPRQRLTSDPRKDARPVVGGPTVVAPTAAHRAVAAARERRGGVIDADAAFSKIQHAQDEAGADAFRRERLLERTWAVWREGAAWVRTTDAQITAARDTLLVRRALQRWRVAHAARAELAARVAHVADARMLRRALIVWGAKLQERRQVAWRADMRARMHTVRKRRELALAAEMLRRWQLAARGRAAERMHDERLLVRMLVKWKSATGRVGTLQEDVEVYALRRDAKTVEQAWERWRWATDLRRREAAMAERVSLRVLGGAWDAWKKRMCVCGASGHVRLTHTLAGETSSWQMCSMTASVLPMRSVLGKLPWTGYVYVRACCGVGLKLTTRHVTATRAQGGQTSCATR